MEPVIQKFRSAVMGGFNRQDVMEYVERTAREHRAQIDNLNKQLEEARQEKEALSAAMEGLQSQSGDLADQEARVRASLEESTRTLTGVRGELEDARGQLAAAKKELSGLQAKVEQLEPLAQRYEALKDRVATVELDAHRRAQATIDEAQAQADRLRAETARWIGELSESYEGVREEICACARKAEDACRAFGEIEEKYQTFLRRSSQQEEG